MLILVMILLFALAPFMFVKLGYWGREVFWDEIHKFDPKYNAGDKVYNTSKIEDIEPYSVVMEVAGYTQNGRSVILTFKGHKYYVRDTSCLKLYSGQNLREERKSDIFSQIIVAVALVLCLPLFVWVIGLGFDFW